MDVAGAAAAIQIEGVGYGRKTMEIRWATRKYCGKRVPSKFKSRIPIYISTNPSHINPQELTELYSSCNHSCHRFPKVNHMGEVVEPVDTKKLLIALSHSSLLVSVFCNSQDLVVDDNSNRNDDEPNEEKTTPLVDLGDLLQRVMPMPVVSPSNGQLVGFGRAVSDLGLTASIYDVMVTNKSLVIIVYQSQLRNLFSFGNYDAMVLYVGLLYCLSTECKVCNY